MDNRIKEFADMIKSSNSALFFGGAGVSTESGVKDYRSEDGLYNTVREYGVSPEVILSHSFFMRKPEVFYDFYYKYFLDSSPEPNNAHKALAELEKMGKLSAVITQNIDGLHQKAGSKRVYELHGTIAENRCYSCGKAFATSDIAALKGGVPHCECGGIIKPRVVLYEEGLDDKVVNGAINAIAKADLLIVGGTSLAVYPAASFLRFFNGDKIVLINKGETAYDNMAKLIFRDSIGEVLKNALDLVKIN